MAGDLQRLRAAIGRLLAAPWTTLAAVWAALSGWCSERLLPQVAMTVRALMLGSYPILSLAAGWFLLCAVDQAGELLYMIDDASTFAGTSGELRSVVAMASAAVLWSLSLFHCTRMVLSREYRFDYRLDDRTRPVLHRQARDWPRAFGFLGMSALPLALDAAHNEGSGARCLPLVLLLFTTWLGWRRNAVIKFDLVHSAVLVAVIVGTVYGAFHGDFAFVMETRIGLALIPLFILVAPLPFGAGRSESLRIFFVTGAPLYLVLWLVWVDVGREAHAYSVTLLSLFALVHLFCLLVDAHLARRAIRLASHVPFASQVFESRGWHAMAPWSATVVLVAAVVAVFALAYGFDRTPVWLGQAIGTHALAFLGLAAIAVIGSTLFTFWPKLIGLPNLAFLPMVLAVLFSGSNDNHIVAGRVIDRETRPRIDEDFRAWQGATPGGTTGSPVFVVAAAGGGARAAYWTAMVLANLDARTNGRFSRHVYAISGVSGGSLGAAAFVASLSCAARAAPAPSPDHLVRLDSFFDEDMLAPLVGSALFPDLMQRYLPLVLIEHDRAWALEQTWSQAWRKVAPECDAFERPLADLYGSPGAIAASALPTRLPRLVLNSTHADSGRRAIAAPVALHRLRPGDGSPTATPITIDAFDLFTPGLATGDLPLRTVVHNSARFPFISPAGTVEKRCATASEEVRPEDCRAVWGSVVDGGYFENSGATTALEIVRLLGSLEAERKGFGPRTADYSDVYLILIGNDPEDVRLCSPVDGCRILAPMITTTKQPLGRELLTPVRALLATREARGDYAIRQLLIDVNADHPAQARRALEFGLSDAHREGRADGHDHLSLHRPPLGWYLAPKTRKALLLEATASVEAFELDLGSERPR